MIVDQTARQRIDWVNVLFFCLLPLVTVGLTVAYFHYYNWEWKWLALLLVSFSLTNMSITCGYHRCFAHKSYEVHPVLKFLYLFVGAGAFQGSVVEWSSDHRRHHQFVDTNDDPYNIGEGLWWAHMGWLFRTEERSDRFSWGKDLLRDPLVRNQHDYYFLWSIGTGVLLPTLIGWAMGNALAGLTFGVGWRLVLSHHTTFLINSLCHYLGRQPYTDKNSARDSLLMAVLTFGEGYHNYHHRFQADYRNGIRWYHWDPSKWAIYAMSAVKLTRGLKRTPNWEIVKARLQMDEKRLIQIGVPVERLSLLKLKVEESQKVWRIRYEEYVRAKQEMVHHSHERLEHLKKELSLARLEFKASWSLWRASFKVLKSTSF